MYASSIITGELPDIIKIEEVEEDGSVQKLSVSSTVPAGKLEQWMCIGDIKLTLVDRDANMDGERLNDLVINFAQKVLRQQFANVKGFQSTVLQEKKKKSNFEQGRIQIVHSYRNHWIVATFINLLLHVV